MGVDVGGDFVAFSRAMPFVRFSLIACALACGFLRSAEVTSVEERLRRLEGLVERLLEENSALRRENSRALTQSTTVEKKSAPAVPTLRLTGDLRTRFSSATYAAREAVARDQFLFQFHFGVVSAVSETIEAGFRFSSGDLNTGFGGTPLSAQFSAGDNGSRKYTFIDRAFIAWKPVLGPDAKAAITLGKSENLFFTPSRILFDTDYMPEGLTEEFSLQLTKRDRLWVAGGQYMLDDLTASSRDPWMFAGRMRWDAQWNSAWSSSLGVGLLSITHGAQLTAANVANTNRGNTRTATGVLVHAYRPFYAEASVTQLLDRAPGYAGKFPVTVQADLLHNPGAPAQNDAWSAGLTLGKAAKAGQWEIGYRYLHIEADAWYEEMLDAEYGGYYRAVPPGWNTDVASLAGGTGGGTNIRSHSIRTGYAPKDYLLLSANLFLNDLVRKIPANSTDTGARRFQLEALVRF